MLCSTFSSVGNRLLEAYPWHPLPICSLTFYWHHLWTTDACGSFSLSFLKALLGETIPLRSHSVLPTTLLHGMESKSVWKWDEIKEGKFTFTLNHIPGAEIRPHLPGREPVVLPNKAQLPGHIQGLTPLPPGLGTGGSAAEARMKALSPARSQAKAACF